MNQPIPIPDEIKPFVPFGTAMDVKEDADKTLFYAVLGSINKGSDAEKKASFKVYIWAKKGDVLSLIPVETPPNNAPRFAVIGGKLMLYGVREEGGAKTAGEWEVPEFVAPASPPDAASILTTIIERLKDPASNVAKAVVGAVVAALMRK